MLIKKYIRTEEGFILFPENYNHAQVAMGTGRSVISAGFIVSHHGGLHCTGESLSLGIKSRAEDTELLKEWLS